MYCRHAGLRGIEKIIEMVLDYKFGCKLRGTLYISYKQGQSV